MAKQPTEHKSFYRMHLEERLLAFSRLGTRINSIDNETVCEQADKARNENPWFTTESVNIALTGVSTLLKNEALLAWTSRYKFSNTIRSRTIALVLAGNIPLVGFHDILCVLVSGNHAQIKLSSKDRTLTIFVLEELMKIEPRFRDHISFVDKVKDFDAVIATGSDNSSRYFEYYFGKYPSIIRKNRTSVAVLTGEETSDELERLGVDVFTYFGLGCRNVSKIFVPENYSIPYLLDHWKNFERVIHHHKYANNYDYQKAIMMVNKTAFFDSGVVLVKESKDFVSPIAVLFYEVYPSRRELEERLSQSSTKIQCVVGRTPLATVPFGQAQFPGPGDYADQVDTLKFLIELKA